MLPWLINHVEPKDETDYQPKVQRKVEDYFPDPPECVHCGKWPIYLLRTCDNCGIQYYAWFLHPYWGEKWCWDCCESNPFHESVPYCGMRKVPPPDSVKPPVASSKELQTIIESLDDFDLDNFFSGFNFTL